MTGSFPRLLVMNTTQHPFEATDHPHTARGPSPAAGALVLLRGVLLVAAVLGALAIVILGVVR